MAYDAFVLVSFGGPERPDDVLPFLQNVTRGRGVPPERLAEVAEHYQHFGGVSPINQQYRDLLAAIRADFAAHGIDLPVYWGNRNWHPMLADTVAQMRDDGVRRALGVRHQRVRRLLVVPAVPGGHRRGPGRGRPGRAGDRQAAAVLRPPRLRRAARRRGAGRAGHARPGAAGHHPAGLHRPLDPGRRWPRTAGPDGGRYTAQLRETARLVPPRPPPDLPYDLVWQSRSGPPQVPWLEPDINDHLAALAEQGVTERGGQPDRVRLRPPRGGLGPRQRGARPPPRARPGLRPGRHPGTDPRFVAMVRELVDERIDPADDGSRTPPRYAADLGHLPGRLLRPPPAVRADRPPRGRRMT